MTSNYGNGLQHILVYLRGAGYSPLPDELCPSDAVGAYANGEGDAVVVVRDRLMGLELRPLARDIAA